MQVRKRVLITGGGTFVGDALALALLAEGAEVSMLVRPGREDHLGGLADRVRWSTADVWESSSLKGRARGQQIVIHTVGSMSADPSQGLTHHYLNFVSARNVANLCVSSGVQHMILISAVRAPWVPGDYVNAKREAEAYLQRVGLPATIIRAPMLYARGQRRKLLHQLASLLGIIPPIAWLGGRRVAPMPVDVFARGVARIIHEPRANKSIYYGGDIRKAARKRDQNSGGGSPTAGTFVMPDINDTPKSVPRVPSPDEAPFGWVPPNDSH